jgi:SPP1 family predicted phage head-tail adaptor
VTELDAGRLRHRVRIEAAVRTEDGGGGASETWMPVAEAWAEIKPASGDEGLSADAIRGRVSHVLHLRAGISVEPEMRIAFGNRVFEIRAVIDLSERRRWLRILAEERDL